MRSLPVQTHSSRDAAARDTTRAGGVGVGAARGRRRAPGRAGAARAGFTLIELMIVIVIVGISAAILAPTVTRAMAINRTNRCQYDAARMFRAARADAIGTGRAHLIDATILTGASTFYVYIGDSSSCTRSQWGGIVGIDAPVDRLEEATYTTSGHGVQLNYQAPTAGPPPRQVCFEPSGERYQRVATIGNFTRGTATLVFAIDRLENGGNAGDPQRQILLPQFGTARVLR